MLIFVRHGEATGNASGLLLGRGEWPLTDRGRAQAAAVADGLRAVGVQRVLTSPTGRAHQTADMVAGACGTGPAVVDDRWVELDYGTFDGMPLGDVPRDLWRRWQADPTLVPAGGESLADLGQRVRTACDELARAGAEMRSTDRHAVVVSHVSPIKAAVAWALGADDGVAWRLYLAPGSVTVIGWGAAGPVVRGYNLRPGGPLVG